MISFWCLWCYSRLYSSEFSTRVVLCWSYVRDFKHVKLLSDNLVVLILYCQYFGGNCQSNYCLYCRSVEYWLVLTYLFICCSLFSNLDVWSTLLRFWWSAVSSLCHVVVVDCCGADLTFVIVQQNIKSVISDVYRTLTFWVYFKCRCAHYQKCISVKHLQARSDLFTLSLVS